MRAALVLVAISGAACGMSAPNGDDTSNDSPTGCSVFLMFDPAAPIAGSPSPIRATAVVGGAPGVLGYTWEVKHGGAGVPFDYEQLDQSSISFFGVDPGSYRVQVAVTGASTFCPTAMGDVNVGVDGAGTTQIRLRVYPAPGTAAPPQEQLKQIPGGPGDYSLNTVAIDPGVMATGFVRMGTTGVQSYLRFIPAGAPDAYVETFTASDGRFDTRTLNQLHDVLVVPTVAGYAPRLVEGWTPGMQLAVDGGTPITGTVRDPGGAAVANAQVQVELDGIPSTLATTNASGAFSVRANLVAGAELGVEVTPPVASGLPRIAGAGPTLTATAPITVQYSAALVRRDLGGTVVRRGGVAQGNAPVKIVGTIGAVASITAGASIPADGEVRIATTTNAGGALPAGTLAPAAPLFAVSQIGAQLAVDAIDLSTAVPATINAPAAVQLDTQLRDSTGVTALPSAMIDFAPDGALELAGAPTIRGVANASGNVSVLVPAGAVFEVRVSDPLGRAAPLRFENVPTAMLSATYDLKLSKQVIGNLQLSGNPQPVGRATVQILCTQCTGVERTRPLAEGSSSSAGAFAVSVFDPGVQP